MLALLNIYLKHAPSSGDSGSSYTLKHAPSFGDSGSSNTHPFMWGFRFIIYRGDSGSSYIVNMPPHLAIPVGGVLFRSFFCFFGPFFCFGPTSCYLHRMLAACRPAVVPCTIFADLISGSCVPFSAQDAGCVCLLLWCGVHCSLTSVIYTCWCCCCCSRPDIYTGCWLHVSPRCGAVRNFR